MSSLLLGFCLIFLISTSEAIAPLCPTSASGSWAEWSMWSGNCSTCTGVCNQARLRLCIPTPILAGCIVEGLSCGGDPIEKLSCNNAGCATTTTTEASDDTTTTSPSAPICGEWAEWSCTCCGGCPTKRCTRVCQGTNNPGCTQVACAGLPIKEDTAACTSPSVSCKFPFPVCCVGQAAYANVPAKAKWCKLGAK
uniref:Uncharacterized protein n=1 Tax=Panagrolaimus superbus TaxID=310955 RepID=A0A914XSG9_9BILA